MPISNVNFTRSSVAYNKTLDEGHLVYGDTLVIVKNVMTLDTDTIRLVNCYIYVIMITRLTLLPHKEQQRKP